MIKIDLEDVFLGKKVLITGHTGFKGSYLTLYLKQLGATVFGYSLPPPTKPSLFELCSIKTMIHHIEKDIRDIETVKNAVQQIQPDFIFHLAAQSLVINSYEDTPETFSTNVQGTVNILEAARSLDKPVVLVVVTTDKVYENKNFLWGYREIDALGAGDPYSTSKAMAELATEAYQKVLRSEMRQAYVATARAGNVIGGGDFSKNRLMVDIATHLNKNTPIPIRNPDSIRPWMHVLDPIRGYLSLAASLKENPIDFEGAWNFGPSEKTGITCKDIATCAIDTWGKGSLQSVNNTDLSKAEMKMLRLNSEKAHQNLKWYPHLCWDAAVSLSIEWYKTYFKDPSSIEALTNEQIYNYRTKSCREMPEHLTGACL